MACLTCGKVGQQRQYEIADLSWRTEMAGAKIKSCENSVASQKRWQIQSAGDGKSEQIGADEQRVRKGVASRTKTLGESIFHFSSNEHLITTARHW